MPSFDRLLVLAVLALSASVQSAPVGPDTGYGVIPAEGGLVPAPGVDQGGVVPASGDGNVLPAPSADEFDEEEVDLDARDFDDEDDDLGEDDDLDEDDEDLATRDFDGEEDGGLEEDDEGPLNLERRASKKTKVAPKPKPTKAPKPKTTKTTKAKATKAKTTTAKTTKAKTTNVKTTKLKTTAKATKTTTPAKTTKAATTPAPTKTAKVTKTKASKTTKATGTAAPSACPIKKPAKKTRTFSARAYDFVAHLFERDNEEFVGWHGTNSDTAAFWAQKGHIEKPVKADGFLDFLKLGTKVKAAKGTSGANAEMGPGLYLADNKDTSIVSANMNVQNNPGTTGALCAIFAKSSGNWRNVIRKAFLPEDIVGDTPEKEAARVAHVKKAVPGVTENTVVRFALLDRRDGKITSQMLIPESVASQFTAKCFKVDGLKVADSDAAASNVGTQEFLNYRGDQLRGDWKIEPENAGTTGAQCS